MVFQAMYMLTRYFTTDKAPLNVSGKSNLLPIYIYNFLHFINKYHYTPTNYFFRTQNSTAYQLNIKSYHINE